MNHRFRLNLTTGILMALAAASACKNRSELDASSGSRVLESRPPRPGETENRPIMDANTFGTGSPGWGRDGVEIEVVKGLSGLDTKQMMEFAEKVSSGSTRTEYARMAKPRYATAFTLGYSGGAVAEVEKATWSRSDHETREANPYVYLMLENGRATYDETAKTWDTTVGTDYNVDNYYDTPDYILLGNDMTIRTRNRMDQPGQIRRVLVQSKIALGVSEQGIKQAGKKDIRVDSTDPEIIDKMDTAAKSGKNVLRGTAIEAAEPIDAIRSIYLSLKERNVLPDLDGKTGVLLLNPQAALFSIRARYHLNFIKVEALNTLVSLGTTILDEVLPVVESASSLTDPEKAELKEMIAGFKDLSLIINAAKGEFESAFPGVTLDAARVTSLLASNLTVKADVRQAHIIQQARNRVLKNVAEKLRPLGDSWDIKRRQLSASGSAGLSLWFRNAAKVFASSSTGEWSNFLIDTFDYSKALTTADFGPLSIEQKLMKTPVPAEKVFFASLINEVQIELGTEKPYTTCIAEAKAAPNDAELQADAEMCTFLLNKLTTAQDYIATRRGEEVQRSLTRAGLNGPNVKWVSGEASKGENILKIARDMPAPTPQ